MISADVRTDGYILQGSINKKLLSCLADFGCWGGGGGLSEYVKKGKFTTKIFFSDNAEWSF